MRQITFFSSPTFLITGMKNLRKAPLKDKLIVAGGLGIGLYGSHNYLKRKTVQANAQHRSHLISEALNRH